MNRTVCEEKFDLTCDYCGCGLCISDSGFYYCSNPECINYGIDSGMKNKVYCKDCKYYHVGSSWDTIDRMYHNFEYCKHKNGHHTIDTYLERRFEYILPSVRNKNNDCKDYEEKK